MALQIAYDGVLVKPVSSGEGHWDTRIQAELENTFLGEREVEILAEIIASNGRVIASGTSRATVPGMSVQTVRMNLPVENPALWDLDTPELFQCKTTVLSDGEPKDFLTIPFGYRTIRLEADTGFWLNGRNIKLKGTCNHHDQAGAGGIKNGTILGVGNGNPNSREEDVAENRQLFHGRAQLIVRNTGVKTVEIAVSCGIADMVHVSIPVCETADSVPYILPVQNQILDGWKLYHKLFDEMPDANLQADVNDMNSFEPISFQGTPQPLFEGHPHSYGMYQVTFLLPAQQRKREISFPHVMGAAWVYLNGKLVHDSSRDMETRFVIPLPENLSGTQEMTVILQNKGENLSGCGIIEPVRLNVK